MTARFFLESTGYRRSYTAPAVFTTLVVKGTEERRNLIWIAPLRAEFRSTERVLSGHADGGLVERGQRMEPLFGATTRRMFGVLVDGQCDLRGIHRDFVAVI